MPAFPDNPNDPGAVDDGVLGAQALPEVLVLGEDGAAEPANAPNALPSQPADKAVTGVLQAGVPVILGKFASRLPSWTGQVLGFVTLRSGIREGAGKGLPREPHTERFESAAESARALFTAPRAQNVMPPSYPKLDGKLAELAFRTRLLRVLERTTLLVRGGVLESQHAVADILKDCWTAVEPMLATSQSLTYTALPLRSYIQASADKAKESKRKAENARDEGREEGREEGRSEAESTDRSAAPTPMVVVQPAPASAPKPPATMPKARRAPR